MAAYNEARYLMIPLSFMLIFGLLAPSVPVEFFISTAQAHETAIPPYFRGLDIGDYAVTHNFTVNDATFNIGVGAGGQRYDYSLAGENWAAYTTLTYTQLRLGKRAYWLLFLIGIEWFTFTTPEGVSRGDELTGSEMNTDFAEEESWIKYRMTLGADPAYGFDCLIGFNTSLYSSPKEALEAEALGVVIGYGLSDLYTTYNVWNIIGALLQFNNPDVPYPLNIIIPALVFGNFAWALLIVFTKLIPGLG